MSRLVRMPAFLLAFVLCQLFSATPHASAGSDAAGTPNGDATVSDAPRWVRAPNSRLYPVGGWRSCAEAAAHADVGIIRGEPGYNPVLDPDNDGVECDRN